MVHSVWCVFIVSLLLQPQPSLVISGEKVTYCRLHVKDVVYHTFCCCFMQMYSLYSAVKPNLLILLNAFLLTPFIAFAIIQEGETSQHPVSVRLLWNPSAPCPTINNHLTAEKRSAVKSLSVHTALCLPPLSLYLSG